jgi:hypothetical protein
MFGGEIKVDRIHVSHQFPHSITVLIFCFIRALINQSVNYFGEGGDITSMTYTTHVKRVSSTWCISMCIKLRGVGNFVKIMDSSSPGRKSAASEVPSS